MCVKMLFQLTPICIKNGVYHLTHISLSATAGSSLAPPVPVCFQYYQIKTSVTFQSFGTKTNFSLQIGSNAEYQHAMAPNFNMKTIDISLIDGASAHCAGGWSVLVIEMLQLYLYIYKLYNKSNCKIDKF